MQITMILREICHFNYKKVEAIKNSLDLKQNNLTVYSTVTDLARFLG